MSQKLEQIAHKILDATSGGLDIILELYPQADTRKNFRIREDYRTASSKKPRLEQHRAKQIDLSAGEILIAVGEWRLPYS